MFKKRTVKKQESVKRKAIDDNQDDSPNTDTPNTTNLGIKTSTTLHKKLKPNTNPSNKPSKETPTRSVNYKTNSDLTPVDNTAVVDTNKTDHPDKLKGPLKPVPTNIKTTTITDFQPDVCKDFQQTGYCGYGDTCKFLHIRGESKNKKPVQKEWEMVATAQTNTNNPTSNINEISNINSTSNEISVPFKCLLCKDDYKFPIKTICSHYYCKQCFMDRVKIQKKNSCFICGKDTNGICFPISKKQMDSIIEQSS